jgi:hypothetical protein
MPRLLSFSTTFLTASPSSSASGMGTLWHPLLNHLLGAFLVRLEASLHDLQMDHIREASFGNMDDVLNRNMKNLILGIGS